MMRGSLERMRVRKERGVAIFEYTSFFKYFGALLDPYTRFIHVETNNKLVLEIKVFPVKKFIYSNLDFIFWNLRK